MTVLLDPPIRYRTESPTPLHQIATPATSDESHPERLLRVGLIGFGRTGRDVARLLLSQPTTSLEWAVRRSPCPPHQTAQDAVGVDSDAPGTLRSSTDTSMGELLTAAPVDVIIDFSSESGIDYYGYAAASRGVAVVSAISHYPDAKQRHLERLARNVPILWSPNITLGINFLLLAAQMLQRISPDADIQIVEEHFRAKQGVSGTANRLARALGAPDDAVHMVRAGGIIGVHEVLFGLSTQTVRLRHEAISREAFGDGALFAARQIVDREAGLYRMEDILLPFFSGPATGATAPPRRSGGVRGHLAARLRAAARRLD